MSARHPVRAFGRDRRAHAWRSEAERLCVRLESTTTRSPPRRCCTGHGSGEAHVLVGVDGHVGGVIVMADELRPDADRIVRAIAR